MTNGHIEIYDPLSRGLTGSNEPESPSDVPETSMEDTVEYRIMMAYAQRKRPKERTPPKGGHVEVNGANGTAPSPISPEKDEAAEEKPKKKPKKKKKGLKGLMNLLSCVKPQTKDKEPQTAADADDDMVCVRACANVEDVSEIGDTEDELGNVADRLTEIAQEIQFSPPEIETDNEENDVERLIGLILREAGDNLNEKELKNANIAVELFWNYGFFKKLISCLLMRMGLKSPNPDSPGPKASPKTQIAVMCEVTSRLSAVDSLPAQRLLDHGARYMQDNFASWAQEQGGYEAAFEEEVE